MNGQAFIKERVGNDALLIADLLSQIATLKERVAELEKNQRKPRKPKQ